jgi:formiminotetrahydrofolate cyclodeaminase
MSQFVSNHRRGAGFVAAQTAAHAARLVATVARETTGWDDAAGMAAQANGLAERLEELAEADAEAFEAALAALAASARDLPMRMEHAAEVPLAIARTAADVAEAARVAAERCDGVLRADAAGAAALAAGAAHAASHLVRANLMVTQDDPRLEQASRAADDARYSAARALDSGA